ncbi:uncharacterized protein LOC125774090 [Anopheles funestus]|uniref:uncharacterized protein LOC125774090 n=1 Tax=Anopheles funestus TaxID=62324 RepID=UPI0020C6B099|nr:uncharacterized protein LOC125774090 [Anopheles funestus]
MPYLNFEKDDIGVPQNLKLADPHFYKKGRIEVLLGARIMAQIIGPRIVSLKPQPCLQESKMGWIMHGAFKIRKVMGILSTASNEHHELANCELSKLIERFWVVEEVTLDSRDTCTSDEIEYHFHKTTHLTQDGRFIVRIPLLKDPNTLGESYQRAVKRFHTLEGRLAYSPDTYMEYKRFMEEYLSLGHMVLIEPRDMYKVKYFIPHSYVTKLSSSSTKLRVVFDASAKTTNNTSLNDIQKTGPNVQRELFDLLIDFRMHTKVLTADIVKMYRQVLVAEEDSWLQCILWRANPKEPLRAYRLLTVTYGEAASSYLACRSLNEVGERLKSTNPKIANAITNNFYVDNLMIGAADSEELSLLKEGIELALVSHGFPLKKWATNDIELLQTIPQQDRESTTRIGDFDTIQTLGVIWSPSEDIFKLKVYEVKQKDKGSLTKRQLFAEVLQMYDPIGLMQPIIVMGKIIMQDLWREKIGWDDKVSNDAYQKWKTIKEQLSILQDVSIPRMAVQSNPKKLTVYGFSDASKKAYGCAIYLQYEENQVKRTTLLCSKSRVAPVKEITLPRLELLAAVLLAELIARIRNQLCHITKEQYYSDSQIVLSWIKSSDNRWQEFVARRVDRIQKATNKDDWEYVSTRENPADLVSRGIVPSKLIGNMLKFWLSGPEFLQNNQGTVNPSRYQYDFAAELEQKKSSSSLLVATLGPTCDDLISNYPHHFSYNKTVKHFALVYRAIQNMKASCKTKKNESPELSRTTGPITVAERQKGLMLIIKIMQSSVYPNETKEFKENGCINPKGEFQHLNATIVDEVIHITGRLENARDPALKSPILVPKAHPFARVIIQHLHEHHYHAGLSIVMNAFRETYWMRDLRRTVQGVLRKCVICARARPCLLSQKMGQLPAERVTESYTFYNTGIDLCGPFDVQPSIRSRAKLSVYACIFVCMATKAIHIEVVENQSTDAFIAALLRFVSLRGKPNTIHSDNGRNFVGANAELKRLLQVYKNEKFRNTMVDKMAEYGIAFKFIPPRSPNFGGLWESNIKVAKRLFTAAARGAIKNSRPLTTIHADPDTPEALTPAHFLIGRSFSAIPMDNNDMTATAQVRWKRVQSQTEQFWRRWRNEYLHLLRRMAKWTKVHNNLQPGQIVLIGDDNMPTAKWPTGVVKQTFPSADGLVRVALVKVKNNYYKRNVRLLAPSPIEV